MKKKILSVVLIVTCFLSIKEFNASEIVNVNLNEIDTNTFIIGNRVFEMNSYLVSIYDVVEAADEYRALNDSKAPIYVLQEGPSGKYLIEYTGSITYVNGKINVPTKKITNLNTYSDGKVFFNGTVKVTEVNGKVVETTEKALDALITNKDTEINNTVTKLNTSLNNLATNGISSFNYNSTNNTLTAIVANEDALLVDYISLGNELLNHLENTKQISYTLSGVKKTIQTSNLTSGQIISLAHEFLSDMAINDSLTLGSVLNQSKTLTVTYQLSGKTKDKNYILRFTK